MQVSTLNFVDLAGSERSTLAAKDDGDNKLRQTEGSAINKSLLTLGNVIRGLGDGRVSISSNFSQFHFVPYSLGCGATCDSSDILA